MRQLILLLIFTAFSAFQALGQSGNFTYYKFWDFEQETVDRYTREEIVEDFNPGEIIYVAPVDIVQDVINGANTKAMRITHLANDLWHGFTMTVPIGGEYDEVYLNYNWKFSKEYNSTHGGKLTGFEAFPVDKNMGPNPPGSGFGFTCKLIFQEANKIATYHYDRTPHDFDGWPWATTDYNYYPIYFSNGTWYNITERIVMNTFTDGVPNTDGIFEVWVDGRMIFKETNLVLMEDESSTMKIDGIEINNYFGGDLDVYAPITECYGYIDNISVYVPENDPTLGTYNTHSGAEFIVAPNEITDRRVYYDELITTERVLSNKEYGSNYSQCIDEAYLIDAGENKSVTFNLKDYYIGGGDFLFFYDGNTTDAPLIRIIDSSIGSDQVIKSSGRYMFIRFSTNKEDQASGWTGTVGNPPVVVQMPESPSQLAVSKVDFGYAMLNWKDNSSLETGFEIERTIPNNSASKTIFTVNANITSFKDDGLQTNTTYQYRMRSFNANGYSGYSNTIQIQTLNLQLPSAPSLLQSQDITENSITIQWKDNSTNEDGFIVKRALAVDQSEVVTIEVGANENSLVDTDLDPGTTYVYTVLASNRAGNSSPSNKNVASTFSVAETKRVKDGLIAYYNFNYDPDYIVHDLSGFETPLDLRIQKPAAVTWDNASRLNILSSTVIASSVPAKKIVTAIKRSNALTFECWIKPTVPELSATSRIISLGSSDSDAGFVLDQGYSLQNNGPVLNYSVRLHTESTNASGHPEFALDQEINYINLQHLVYVRDSLGTELIYVNGEKAAEGFRPSNFTNWNDAYYLKLGNENTLNLPWTGAFYSFAIYNKALSVDEINNNYSAGPCDSLQNGGVSYSINVYPNPVTQKATVEISPSQPAEDFVPLTVIRIVDLFGKIHFEEILFNPNSHYMKTLDFSNYSKGMYFLEVISGNHRKATKIVLQ